MSLDVYLHDPEPAGESTCEACGGTGKVGAAHSPLFDANITHNLTRMADAAGIYQHLWRPEEIGITKAHQLAQPLRDGLARLRSDPDRFKTFNPENGWGSYDGLVRFVVKYLAACEEYPDADVSASR
jgi:hypothetical protein